MIKNFLLPFILLLFSFCVSAQKAPEYIIKSYNTENGLPSNGIKGLQWDERTNFLWIATEAGIVRFNGSESRIFTNLNTPFITTERTVFIIRNNHGKIYASDLNGTIIEVDENKITPWQYQKNYTPTTKSIYLLNVADSFYINRSRKKTNEGFGLPFSKVVPESDTATFIQSNGRLFYFSISMADPQLLDVGENTVRSFFKLNNHFFLQDSKNDLFEFSFKNKIANKRQVAIEESGNSLSKLNGFLYWENGMKHALLFSGQSAWHISFNGTKIISTLICDNLPTDSYIQCAQYSEELKILFVGTDSKGMLIFYPKKVSSKKRQFTDNKKRNAYYSQIELSNGNVLTNEGDVLGDATSTASLPIKEKFNYSIYRSPDSILWYVQQNKELGHGVLKSYDYKNGSTKEYKKITLYDQAAFTYVDNQLYVVFDKGIAKTEGDSLQFVYPFVNNEVGNLVYRVLVIKPGVLAIATCKGTYFFDLASKKLTSIYKNENFCVRSLWYYNDYLFFGTYGGGFFCYKNGVLKKMPLDKNKYLLYAHCFIPDKKGFCWISTNRGLFKANIAELTQAFDKNYNSVYYYYYGKNDGMEMTELNGGCTPCAIELQNKNISFPTMDGLLWVNPQTVNDVLPTGNIYIDEFLANNILYNPDSLQYKPLPANTNEIKVVTGFATWSNKENIYLEYQLNDTVNWKSVNIETDAAIRLYNLSSGNYVLRIRKVNGFGSNNYTYKTIEFSIKTPWYKTWYFYLLCLGAVFGTLALYLKWRTRQFITREKKLEKQVAEKTKELKQKNEVLEKNNSIKTRLISIISHDIVTPLKFLTVAGKNLLDKKEQMSEELQKETIKEITNTSQELQLLSTNILNWIKYQNENRLLVKENFNLHEMVSQVLGLLQSLARQKNLTVVNNVPPSTELYQYYEHLKILIYNLLTNAIHFTEKGSITVSAVHNLTGTTVSVKDEGVGMSDEQIQRLMADEVVISSANIDNKKGHGLGYLIIKDLLKTMDATINIESKKNMGTVVEIRM